MKTLALLMVAGLCYAQGPVPSGSLGVGGGSGGGSPTGAAGGVLTGTYPNPGIAASLNTNAATATALAANPTNCSAGSYPLGIAANGNVENCTVAATATLPGGTTEAVQYNNVGAFGGTANINSMSLMTTLQKVLDMGTSFYPSLANHMLIVEVDGFPSFLTAHNEGDGNLHYYHCSSVGCTGSISDTIVGSSGQFNAYSSYVSINKGPDGLGRVIYKADDGTIGFVQCTSAGCAAKASRTLVTAGSNWGEFSATVGPDGFVRIGINNYTDHKVYLIRCNDAACSVPVSTALYTFGGGSFMGIAVAADNTTRLLDTPASNSLTYYICGDADCTSFTNVVAQTGMSFSYFIGLDINAAGNVMGGVGDGNNGRGVLNLYCATIACGSPVVTALVHETNVDIYTQILNSDGTISVQYVSYNPFIGGVIRCFTPTCSNYAQSIFSQSTSPNQAGVAQGADGFPVYLFASGSSPSLFVSRVSSSSALPISVSQQLPASNGVTSASDMTQFQSVCVVTQLDPFGAEGGTASSNCGPLMAGSASLTFGSLADGLTAELTFNTLYGANEGNLIIPGWPSDLETGLIGTMFIRGQNTVVVRLLNMSGASITVAAHTFAAAVARR